MIDSELTGRNKKILLGERRRLHVLLARVADDGKPKYPDMGNTEDDNAAEVVQYETNVAEEYDLQEKLQRVEAALSRIEAGTYGVCQVGGEDMPTDRLEAIPEAENCVEHEKK